MAKQQNNRDIDSLIQYAEEALKKLEAQELQAWASFAETCQEEKYDEYVRASLPDSGK